MNQKKSLVAVALTFALVFSSFSVFPANAAGKGETGNPGRKKTQPLKAARKTTVPKRCGNFTKADLENAERINRFPKNLKKPKYPHAKANESYNKWEKRLKRYKKALKNYRKRYQKFLSKTQKLAKSKVRAYQEMDPSCILAIEAANARNKELVKYNKKARRINKARYDKAKKRWKKRHKRGKIRYKKVKIKKYVDANNIYKHKLPKDFDHEYIIDENSDCPINNSVQIKLTWKPQKGDTENTKYYITKCSFPTLKTGKQIIETYEVNKPEFVDPTKYTDETLEDIPECYFIHSYKEDGKDFNFWNTYHPNGQDNYTETATYKLLKMPVDYSKIKTKQEWEDRELFTGFSAGYTYFLTKEYNKLRMSVKDDPEAYTLPMCELKYSEEINKYMNIRAKECEEKFSHERPDGSNSETVFPEEKQADPRNFKNDMKNGKWSLGLEGIATGTFDSRVYEYSAMKFLWDSPDHKGNLCDREATHAGVGAYIKNGRGVYLAVTPISVGEEGLKRCEGMKEKRKEDMDSFLSACNLNPDNYRTKADQISKVNKIGGSYCLDNYLSIALTKTGAIKLCKPYWYDGMSLVKVVGEFCNRAVADLNKYGVDNRDEPSAELHALMKECVENNK